MTTSRPTGGPTMDSVAWSRRVFRGLGWKSALAALVSVASLAGATLLFAQSHTGTANLGVQVAPALQLTTNGTTTVSLWIRLATGGTGSLWGDSTNTCNLPISGATTYSASGKYNNIPLSSIPFTSSNTYVCAYDPGAASPSAYVLWPHTPASLAFSQQPTNTVSGASISPAVTVQVLDSNGLLDTSSTASVTLAIGTNPGGSTLSGTVTQSAANGVATFSNLSLNKAGTGYTLTAASTGLTSATSNSFTVNAGAINHFAISAISSPQTAGTAFNIATITAQDANNNTVTGFTSSVTFGGTAGVTGTSVAFTAGILSGASVTPTIAGSNVTVTVTDGSGHTGSATITTVDPASQTITVTTPAPASAVYGGNFTVAATASSGLVVTYSSAGGCSNVGATFTMTSGTTACTVKFDQAGNATYGAASEVTESVTAQRVPLTVSGITANTKVYDGTVTATLNTGSAALVGVISGDSGNVTLNTASATGAFSDRNVGTSKTVTVSGLTISGTSAGNYTLAQPTTTATITAKALTITGSTASAKVYDGTTVEPLGGTAALLTTETAGTGTTSDGKPYSVDSVAAGGTATGAFANKNAGTALAVTVTGVTVTGTGSGNYTVTQQTGLTTNITKRPITVSAATNSKTYDGTTSAASIPTITSGTLASGDTANFTEVYSTKDVGLGNKTLVPSGTVSDGNSGNNYAYTFVNVTNGTITARALTVTSTNQTKVYGQTVTFGSGSTLFTSSGLQNSETIGSVTLAVSGNGGAATATVSGSPYTITPSAATGGTFTASDYTITYATGTLTVSQATTSSSVSSSVNPSVAGQSVTFTATVTDSSSGSTGTPTGTVQFKVDGTNLGSAVTLSGGSATSTATTTLTAGNHVITAVYSSDSNFTTSTGTLSGGQDVQDFTLTETTSSGSVSQGSTLTETSLLSLTNQLGGFSGAVALTCSDPTSGQSFTCNGTTGSGHISFSPTSISGIGTSTMTAQAASNTKTTQHVITITGTFGSGTPSTGGLTHTVQFTITVN